MATTPTEEYAAAHFALGVWYMERYETLDALQDEVGTDAPDAERAGDLYLSAEALWRQGVGIRRRCANARALMKEAEHGDAEP